MGKKKGITAKEVAEIIELKLTGKNEEQKANEIMDFLEPPDKGGKMKNEDYDKLPEEVKAWHVKAVADSVKRAETAKEKAKGKGVTAKKEASAKKKDTPAKAVPKVKKKAGKNGNKKVGLGVWVVEQFRAGKFTKKSNEQIAEATRKKFNSNTSAQNIPYFKAKADSKCKLTEIYKKAKV